MATGWLDSRRIAFQSNAMPAPKHRTQVRALLWDFGDTLCDETWMLSPMANEPRWAVAYQATLARGGLIERWDLGAATTAEVANSIAAELGMSIESIAQHMNACCRNIRLNRETMMLAEARAAPQAIVTVNCDIFSEVVVPAFDLHRTFSHIVTSWQEGTVDKAELCEIARLRLDPSLPRDACLLLDNRKDNIDAWRAMGGLGHHYRGEEDLMEAWQTFDFPG
ncbi:MAG TPA: hypothetical protein VG227_04775 [Caulobacteraceae bacterium]|nr:hypothetical protein [Caulobacteraceae bacterium]